MGIPCARNCRDERHEIQKVAHGEVVHAVSLARSLRTRKMLNRSGARAVLERLHSLFKVTHLAKGQVDGALVDGDVVLLELQLMRPLIGLVGDVRSEKPAPRDEARSREDEDGE